MLTRPSSRISASASALALATALVAGPAHGQASTSYNAPDPTIVSGSVNFNRGSVAGVETYNINSPTAVIDFTPFDSAVGGGPINFQTAGTSVTYQGVSNFTVLNRIVPADPTRAIQFNGDVISRVGAGAPIAGGSVWFYSPGGIILGSSAQFDVGSLLLATGDPTGGSGTIGSTSSFSIASGADTNYAITIQSGASIKATPEGSYVALVAPVVNQTGSVQVNGSAAYVAAEQASLTINQGLFDIDVVVGSDGGGAPLTHLGTTGGPSSTGGGDNHGIFMVAVPKNTAITMLIAPSGNLGFDPAGSAFVENGAIYLQAGGDLKVTPGNPVESRVVSLPDSALGATISLAGGNSGGSKVTSTLVAQATGNTTIQSTAANRLISLDADAYIYSAKTASLTNSSGQAFTAAGRTILNAIGPTSGQANVLATAGSSMVFQDDLEIYASPFAGRTYDPSFAVNQGGTAFLQANGVGATISVAGQSRVFAAGVDPAGTKDTSGGSARVFASNGGQITLSQGTSLNADASAIGLGRTATGGFAILEVDNGTLTINGATAVTAVGQGSLSANAVGGTARFLTNAQGGTIAAQGVTIDASGISLAASSGPGGSGKGGTAAFDLSTTTNTASVTATSVTQLAEGRGGNAGTNGSFTGGAATGGLVRTLVFKNTSATIANGFTNSSQAFAGAGGPSGAGGAATAGSATVQVSGALTFQNAVVNTGAFGGAGGVGAALTTPGGNGGTAAANAGGIVFQALNAGTITAQSVTLRTNASGGTGGQGKSGTGLVGSGGSATSGAINLSTTNNGQVNLSVGLTADATASAGSTGFGAGGSASGGNATAGTISISAGPGLLQFGDIDAFADAFGGNGSADASDGGDAIGGGVFANAQVGGVLRVTSGELYLSANADGGNNSGGGDKTAGKATAGTADINANGGTIEVSGTDLTLTADAFGGDYTGSSGGTGGAATGGNARAIASAAGIFTINTDVAISAIGFGGATFSSPDGTGGAGTGGEARIGTNIGSPVATTMTVSGDVRANADGFGGNGGSASGIGGTGVGGTPADTVNGPFDKGAYLAATGGAVTIGGDVDLSASGSAGDGGAQGGTATGGWVETFISGSTLDLNGALTLDSSGIGGTGLGEGGKGGNGTGGFAAVTAASGGRFGVPTNATSRVTGNQILLNAGGEGGGGGDGALGAAGGRGGDGVAGQANAIAQAGGGVLQAQNVFIFLAGEGGSGGQGGGEDAGGIGGAGGRGGDGTGGFTNLGTASGPDTPINSGSATFGDVSVFLAGVGGTGGDGMVGSKGGGAAGNGGDAFGGTGAILTRGAPVTANAVSILSQAVGGTAGSGAAPGTGGAATGGRAGILASNRFNRTERGFLSAVQVSAASSAIGGFNGASFAPSTAGQAYAQVSKADVVIDNLQLSATGDAPAPAGFESFIKIDNGLLETPVTLDVNVTGDFQLSVVDNGILRADTFNLFATGSLLPPIAGTPGLIEIGSFFQADFQQDFITTANFDVDGSFFVTAGGALQVGNVRSGESIELASTGDLTAGNLTAGDNASLIAEGSLTAGDIQAANNPAAIDGFVTLQGSTGVLAGDISGVSIDIDDGTSAPSITGIKVGRLTAENIVISGTADVTTGTLLQGDVFANSDVHQFGQIFVTAAGQLTVSDMDLLNSVFLSSDTAIKAATITAGDSITLFSEGTIATDNLIAGQLNSADAFGEVTLAAFGSVTTGNIKAAVIDFEVGDPAAPASVQTGNLLAETITLDVGGTLVTGDVTTNDVWSNIDTTADDYLIGIGALGDVKLGQIDAFSSIGVGSVLGKVETGAIFAADSVLLLGKTGVATGAIQTGGDAAGSVFISNTSIIETNPDFAVLQDFSELGESFDIDVLKTALPERVAGPVSIAGDVSTPNFAAATTQNFVGGAISAPSRFYLDVGGSITGGNFSTAGALTLKSDQSIDLADLSATSVSVTGSSVTTRNVNATGAVNITATGFAFITGQVLGSTIDVTSGDIAIGSGGGLGGSGTSRLTLTATGSSPRFGGTIGDTQYSLDSAEATRLRAQLIELRSSSSALVGEMTLQGSLAGATANLVGDNGRLVIDSGSGSGITVVGQVTINNAGNNNRLTLNASEGLNIATDQGGGIAMFGSSNATLGGVLEFNTNALRVATSSLLDQLGSLPTAQRAQALRTPPPGTPRPEGYLQARRIQFRTNQLYIQNSNTASIFGGFSAGSGGALLESRSGSATPVDAVIFGRIADASGTFKVNQEAVSLLTLGSGEGGPTSVTPTSTFNDCPFVGSCGSVEPPPEEEEDEEVELMIDRIPAVVAAAVNGAMASTTDPESVAALPTVNLVTTIDTGPLRTEPVISDPVTGGGNPGLWEAPNEQNRDEDERPAPGGDGQ